MLGENEKNGNNDERGEWETWKGDSDSPFWQHAVAGSCAGVMEHILVYPIDTIKTRIQSLNSLHIQYISHNSSAKYNNYRLGRIYPYAFYNYRHFPSSLRGKTKKNKLLYAFRNGIYRNLSSKKFSISSKKICSVNSSMLSLKSHFLNSFVYSQIPVLSHKKGTANKTSFRRNIRNLNYTTLSTFEKLSNSLSLWSLISSSKYSLPSFSSISALSFLFPHSIVTKIGHIWPVVSFNKNALHTIDINKTKITNEISHQRAFNRKHIKGFAKSHMCPINSVHKVSGRSKFNNKKLVKPRTLIKELYNEGGIRHFFRGITAIAGGCIPAHASYFVVYETVKDKFSMEYIPKGSQVDENASHVESSRRSSYTTFINPLYAAASGSLATISHDLILTPMDVVKQRLQLGCYRNTWDCVKTVSRHEGYIAFFRSFPTTMLMNIPYGAVMVCSNEFLKSFFNVSTTVCETSATCEKDSKVINDTDSSKTMKSNNLGNLIMYFVCAGVSGGLAAFISNPLDVVKTRLQTQDCRLQMIRACKSSRMNVNTFTPIPAQKYNNLFSALSTVWVEEGLAGFWRGTSARVALSVPGAAISWGTYESVKFALQILHLR